MAQAERQYQRRWTAWQRIEGGGGFQGGVRRWFAKQECEAGRGQGAAPRRSIVPVNDGDVSIYFPAVKESSGLRFHIHAPFASTVARDSVRDDPGNVRLVGDIARLIAEALPGMCTDGLIDDSFLDALPNDDDQIGRLYDQIRDAITEAFNDLEITPVRGTGAGFAVARTLVASPSEFRNWLDPADLPTLLDFAGIASAVTHVGFGTAMGVLASSLRVWTPLSSAGRS